MDDGISEYKVLKGTADELQAMVSDQLGEGWLPLGGVAAAANFSAQGEIQYVFAQAMVRAGGHKRSLAVTVPIVATHDEDPAAADSHAGANISGPVVKCPLCHAAIVAELLRDGLNTCTKCHREIMVEWGG